MTIAETTYGQAPSYQTEETMPQPLDKKVLSGVALRGEVSMQDLFFLGEKLVSAFEQMQTDSTGQFATCLAYAVRVSEEAQSIVDRTMKEALESKTGQKLIEYDMSETNSKAWFGTTGKQSYVIYRHDGWIPMNDSQEPPKGVTYSLIAVNATEFYQAAQA